MGLALVGFVGLPLLVGLCNGLLTARQVSGWYLSLNRPPGTPPNWLFGPVWTVLYVMMGVAAWLVWRRATQVAETSPTAASQYMRLLRLWGWQLLLNAAWTPVFFGLHRLAMAQAVILLLLAALVATIAAFARVHRQAAALMLPYLGWTCYATYLNAGFLWLNPGF